MKNLSVENVYTRATAKELTRKYFWKLLGMSAVAFGIPYAMMFAVNLLTTPMTQTQPGLYMVLTLVLSLAVSLATCGLTLGLLAAMINLCRGQDDLRIGAVFSHMGYTLKAFGLGLWVALKTLFWMLPGYVVIFAGLVGTMSSVDMTTGMISESAAGTMVLLMFGGLILMLVLGLPATYRYMMANYILADKPDTGVFACVRESKAMMKGHKWQCFKLIVPIILVLYVIMLVVGVALGAASAMLANTPAAEALLNVITMIVMVAVSIVYMIRMYLCYALFYVKRADAPADETSAE